MVEQKRDISGRDRSAAVNRDESQRQPPFTALPWRSLIKIEPSGVRTALAATFPLFVGQIAGQTAVGLMIALGALNVSVADKDGADLRTMGVAVVAVAVTGMIATVVGGLPWLSVLLMFG